MNKEESKSEEMFVINTVSKNKIEGIYEFEIGEHIDCLDSVKKWCNAEIVAVSFR